MSLIALRRSDFLVAKRHHWAVVLAGGDGTRLQTLTRFISGDDRPKQFCPVFDGKTLLGQTLDRAHDAVPPYQTLVSLVGRHYGFFDQEPSLDSSQRAVQPENKGTAPPIVHSLLSIGHLDADALVAILPSDHFFADETAFTSALEAGFHTAALSPDSIVLMGTQPDYAETEYGWIELGEPRRIHPELYQVRAFHEKPQAKLARRLLASSAVWNTFIMVGHVQAFLGLMRRTVPDLIADLSRSRLWAGEETNIDGGVYRRLASVNFSDAVLAKADSLLVYRMQDSGWSDLGNPARVASTIRRMGVRPAWFDRWCHARSESPIKVAAIA